MSFDPSTQQWSYAGESPWYGTAGAAVVNKGDKTWLINGEAKPGLRTDAVFELDFTGNNLKWNKLAPVSSPDGVAGGFAGISNDSLIFAGGAGFKGSRENYQNGKNYAHEGLKNHIALIFIFGITGNGINRVNYRKVGPTEYHCPGIIVY